MSEAAPEPGNGGGDGATTLDPTEYLGDPQEIADETEGVANHAEAEGAEAGSPSRFESFKRMLMQSEPDKPLDEVEAPFDTENGGASRFMRGLQKIGGFDGTPAVYDLVVGPLEALWSYQVEGGTESGGESDETDDLPDAPDGVDPITAAAEANREP